MVRITVDRAESPVRIVRAYHTQDPSPPPAVERMKTLNLLLLSFLTSALTGCGSGEATTKVEPSIPDHVADIVGVDVLGEAGAFTFRVTVASPDSGCARYADWWEVLTTDGELLYRRVLLHSHTSEQPFTRSGSSVSIQADQVVWVRAHMHPDGYGGQALQGSPAGGFTVQPLSPEFAVDVAQEGPLPTGCAF
jgi:hypothetical protein